MSREKKTVLDLCSGLGGFSQPFIDVGWDVVRIDNNPKFKDVPNTFIGDIRDLDFVYSLVRGKQLLLIVASPPCERFSIANRMFPKKGIREALDIIGSIYEIIAELRPRYWIVENPRGRLRWFLGKPNSTIHLSDYGGKYMKPTDLWHNFKFGLIEGKKQYEPSRTSIKNQGKGSTGLLRLRDPSKRALLPYGLGESILKIIEGEKDNE